MHLKPTTEIDFVIHLKTLDLFPSKPFYLASKASDQHHWLEI
jgi:hypothetical protein